MLTLRHGQRSRQHQTVPCAEGRKVTLEQAHSDLEPSQGHLANRGVVSSFPTLPALEGPSARQEAMVQAGREARARG